MADDAKNLPELSGEAQKILDAVKNLSVLDMANLVKHMEDVFGVSAAAPAAVAMAAPSGDAAAPAEEKSMFNVIIKDGGANKIAVIKVVRELTELGLMEAKGLVDATPSTLKENVAKEEAEDMKKKLEEAGATVELQ